MRRGNYTRSDSLVDLKMFGVTLQAIPSPRNEVQGFGWGTYWLKHQMGRCKMTEGASVNFEHDRDKGIAVEIVSSRTRINRRVMAYL